MTAKSLRLSFKGEKSSKSKSSSSKRKHHSSHRNDGSKGDESGKVGQSSSSIFSKRSRNGKEEDGEESDVADVGGDELTWVDAVEPTDLAGPSLLYARHQGHHLAINFDDFSSSVRMQRLDEVGDGGDVRPTQVSSVLVATRVLDTHDPPRYTFRTTSNTFLGADRVGTVLSTAEARGPQEEWSVVPIPSDGETIPGLALRSYHGTYLSLDEVLGNSSSNSSRFTLRCDATSVGPHEVWHCRLQWKFRHQSRNTERAHRQVSDVKQQRAAYTTTLSVRDGSLGAKPGQYDREARQALDAAKSREERRAIKRAVKEGQSIKEALMDLRAKGSSDKFAK